jgi:hypothetical protein
MLKILSIILAITINIGVFQRLKQENSDNQTSYAIVEGDANSCEANNRFLEILGHKAKNENENIIIIARLGFRERSSKLNKLRLDKTKRELVQGIHVPEEKIITAQGEPISSQGRVEFYFKGKLFLVSLVEKDKNICTNCC